MGENSAESDGFVTITTGHLDWLRAKASSPEPEAVREALAVAIEGMAAQFVEVGKRMQIPFGEGQRAKHAGYLEAASCVRHADLSDLSTPPAPGGDS